MAEVQEDSLTVASGPGFLELTLVLVRFFGGTGAILLTGAPGGTACRGRFCEACVTALPALCSCSVAPPWPAPVRILRRLD